MNSSANLNSFAIEPFAYKLFGAGKRIGDNPAKTISNVVIHDCSGAYDYIDKILQDHPAKSRARFYAIVDKNRNLKQMEEFAKSPGNFCVMPIPYAGEEEKVLKRSLPKNLKLHFWEHMLLSLAPKDHYYSAINVASKLLKSDYNLILCSDRYSNTRIVVSTLRGKGVAYRSDLLSVIGESSAPAGHFKTR